MTAFDRWQTANEEYLSAGLRWLRARLRRMVEMEADNGDPAQLKSAPDIDSAYRNWQAAIQPTELPALELLRNQLDLSSFELQVILLCSAMEFLTDLPDLCAIAQRNALRTYPTFALAMMLFDEPSWDAMSPDRPLRRLRLLEINQQGTTPLTAAALKADERVVNYLKGLNHLDDLLSPLLMPLDVAPNVTLPDSQQLLVTDVLGQLEQHNQQVFSNRVPFLQLVGTDAASKHAIADAISTACGRQLLRLPIELIPTDLTALDTLLHIWDREQRLLPLALYVDASEANQAAVERAAGSLCARFLTKAAGLIFLDTCDVQLINGRPTIVADVAKPTTLEQRSLWQSLLGPDSAQTAAHLAGQFSLNAPTIQQIVNTTKHSVPPEVDRFTRRASQSKSQHATPVTPCLDYAYWTACRKATRPRLDALAKRIESSATWDDLVLAAEDTRQLRDIANQVRSWGHVYDDWGFRRKHNRGLGVTVLFSGESGTGKTMAAEVIANELQLDLYRVDLSAVVNKYIGETEKNLRKLFDAADDGGVILFFDEADSLFGKRTEVKDSHDRYANLEVNYLLQRMESYRGLAILATNLRSSLDVAFMRRLRFVVNFALPEAGERKEMWRKAFPAEMPTGKLDLERLSKLPVTGGNIHTIALNAAFDSASGQRELSMPHILRAARTEFRKLQKPINAADFRCPDLEGAER